MPFPALLPLLGAAGAVASSLGALREGKAAEQAGKFNARVAEENAQVAMQLARQEATQIERDNTLRLGAIRAQAGATGVTFSGSVIDLIGDVAAQGELQRQNAIFRGTLEARGFTITAQQQRAAGKAARKASFFKAAGALLGGASSFRDVGESLLAPKATFGTVPFTDGVEFSRKLERF